MAPLPDRPYPLATSEGDEWREFRKWKARNKNPGYRNPKPVAKPCYVQREEDLKRVQGSDFKINEISTML